MFNPDQPVKTHRDDLVGRALFRSNGEKEGHILLSGIS